MKTTLLISPNCHCAIVSKFPSHIVGDFSESTYQSVSVNRCTPVWFPYSKCMHMSVCVCVCVCLLPKQLEGIWQRIAVCELIRSPKLSPSPATNEKREE